MITVHKRQIGALPSQKLFYQSEATFKGFSGPVGTGKTYALCWEAIKCALRNPRCPGVVGAPTYPMLADVTIPTMLGILEEQRIPFRYWEQRPRILLTRSKSLILFRSTEKPDRLRGMNLAWFGLDEMTYCRAAAWDVLCQRIRSPRAQHVQGFGCWTPKGYDWVYQKFISPKRKEKGYDAILAGAAENVVVLEKHPEYYERLKGYDELFYRQEVLGEYLNIFAGSVYHGYDEKVNERETRYQPNLGPLSWALDFNIDPMASIICQRKGQLLEVFEEMTLQVGTIYRMCEKFADEVGKPYVQAWRNAGNGGPLPVKVYGDASGTARSLVGKASYDMMREFFRDRRDYELHWNTNTSNPPVKDRVLSVNAALKNAAGQSRIFVHPEKCKELITDFYEVTWRPDDQTEIDKKRDKKRTHWSDALGYLVYKDMRVEGFERVITPATGPAYKVYN